MIVAGRVGATDAHGHGCPADTSGVAAAARSARLATWGLSVGRTALGGGVRRGRSAQALLPVSGFCMLLRALSDGVRTHRAIRPAHGFPGRAWTAGDTERGVCSDALARPHETWQLLSVRRIARGGRRRGLRAK